MAEGLLTAVFDFAHALGVAVALHAGPQPDAGVHVLPSEEVVRGEDVGPHSIPAFSQKVIQDCPFYLIEIFRLGYFFESRWHAGATKKIFCTLKSVFMSSTSITSRVMLTSLDHP